MEKSKKSNRGGARKNSGRKPKGFITQSVKPEILQASSAAVARLKDIPTGPASVIAPEAFAALRHVINNPDAPAAARVAAAKAVIELAKAEQSSSQEVGKKAVAETLAHARVAEGGRFAVPAPPRAYDA